MSRKPTLAALKQQIDVERRPAASAPLVASAPPTATAMEPQSVPEGQGRVIRGKRYPTYREGKVPVGGYFSPELSRALHQIALDESVAGQPRVKIQALIGEAIDLLLRDRGKSPFGER
jgi:hypothetical protein